MVISLLFSIHSVSLFYIKRHITDPGTKVCIYACTEKIFLSKNVCDKSYLLCYLEMIVATKYFTCIFITKL